VEALRCGKVTASRVADVVAKTKTGYSASRANYMAQLIAERLTGTPAETYTNAAMQHGTETEPEARAAYEFYQGVTVRRLRSFPIRRSTRPVPAPMAWSARTAGRDQVPEYGNAFGNASRPSRSRQIRTRCSSRWPARAGSGATSFPTIRGCRKTCGCSSSACPATTSADQGTGNRDRRLPA
jgi:hypothetical protein